MNTGSMYGPILSQGDLAALHGNESANPPPLEYMTPPSKRDGGFWMDGTTHGSVSCSASISANGTDT